MAAHGGAGDSAEDALGRVERALREHFEQEPARASVSFLGVESIEVLRFAASPDQRVYVSLGMSRYPMTAATRAVIDPADPRAELVLRVRPGPVGADVWRALAVLAAAPAVESAVYAAGATVDLGATLTPGSQCCGGVLARSEIGPVPHANGGGAPVELLEVLPATANELAWARVHGSERLRARWRAQSIDPSDLGRTGADLSGPDDPVERAGPDESAGRPS